MSTHVSEEVLSFWLGTPATTAEGLGQKFQRWYQGTPALDLEIDTRFGSVIERAQAGGLDDWTRNHRGRLALVIVLDQFPAETRRWAGRRPRKSERFCSKKTRCQPH